MTGIVRGPLSAFSEVVDDNRRWTADWYSWLSDLSTPMVGTFSQLPPPSVAGPGARAFCTDVPNPVNWMSVVSGGSGPNKLPLVCDGTNWRQG